MLKSIKQKKLGFQSSFILSILLHIILIIFGYYNFPIKNIFMLVNETNSLSIDLTHQPIKTSSQTSTHISEEKKTYPSTMIQNTVTNKQNNPKKDFDESNLNDLLNKLINNKDIIISKKLYMQSNNCIGINEKKNEDKFNKINTYKEILTHAITDKFYSDPNFSGKKCILHITLDDRSNIIKSFKGDFRLCQAAISAVKLAKLPDPPNLEVSEVFKNVTLNFSP